MHPFEFFFDAPCNSFIKVPSSPTSSNGLSLLRPLSRPFQERHHTTTTNNHNPSSILRRTRRRQQPPLPYRPAHPPSLRFRPNPKHLRVLRRHMPHLIRQPLTFVPNNNNDNHHSSNSPSHDNNSLISQRSLTSAAVSKVKKAFDLKSPYYGLKKSPGSSGLGSGSGQGKQKRPLIVGKLMR
ncbi:hypothetical protein RIF29_14455 [Crotalaria pallida]|uniref:Uncharacterized protein n=1 Tax=Crotalaria pallida TaxID=3830 RepID=A0AAN9FFD7_CROPI